MITLRRIKHNFLIKFMTSLGFGGMVVFYLSSCDSAEIAGYCLSRCDSDNNKYCLSKCDSAEVQDTLYKLDPNQPTTTLDMRPDETPSISTTSSIVKQPKPLKAPDK